MQSFCQWLGRRKPARPAIVFSPGYHHAAPGSAMDPSRAERVMAALRRVRAVRDRDVIEPQPIALRDLLRIHTPEYLESLGRPAVLHKVFGCELGAREAELALDVQRLMVGGTTQAVRRAVRQHASSVHLGGGLHHAHPSFGAGYCAYNDVAVAIACVRADGFAGRVLVVDLDLHDGDGTRTAFAADASVHTFSVHGGDEDGQGAVESTAIPLGHGVDGRHYVAVLRAALPRLLARWQPALVVYVAGVDVAADDAVGDFDLSPDDVFERDRFVVESVRALASRPALVVVLGGGYGERAWRPTARFCQWLLTGRDRALPSQEELILDGLRQVDLVSESPFELTADDLPGLRPAARLFLDQFPRESVELILERAGVLDNMRAHGYRDLRTLLDDGELGQRLRVTAEGHPRDLLLELRAHRTPYAVIGHELLAIEWLLLQHPRGSFTPHRPRLPGQKHPGLGVLKDTLGVRPVRTAGARRPVLLPVGLSHRRPRPAVPARSAAGGRRPMSRLPRGGVRAAAGRSKCRRRRGRCRRRIREAAVLDALRDGPPRVGPARGARVRCPV